MTIEAGALALRISETGADQVLAKLEKIDQKAAALGKAIFNAPSATGVNGQVQQLSANFTQVAQASTSATVAMEKQVATQAKVATSAAAIGAEASGVVKAAGAFAGMASALGAIGVVISAGAVLSGLVNLVREAIDLGDNLHDLTMRTGVSVETLSILGPVAQKSGASMEILTMGLRNLNKETDKARLGNKEAIQAFQQIGISVDQLKGKSPEQVFLMVANALEQYEDGAFKVNEAQKLLGRSGEVLIPTMHELANGGFEAARAHAEALGAVMNQDFADKSDAFNDQLGDLHTSLLALGMVIADPLLPFLTRMADLFTMLIVKAQGFGTVIENLLVRTPFIGPLMGIINGILPTSFAGVQAGSSSTAPFKKKAPPPPPATARPEDRARMRAIEKALGADLGDIPIGLTNTDPLNAPGFFPTVGTDSKGKMKGVKGSPQEAIAKIYDDIEKEIAARTAKLRPFVESAAQIVGSAFGDAFSAAFKGGNFFAAFGKSLISSLGNIVMQLGEQMLAYGLVIAPLASLLNFTPFGSLGLGAGASIAAGLALTALGAAMGAVGGGGKGGSGGGAGGRTGNGSNSGDDTFAMQFDPDGKLRRRAGPAVVPSSRALSNAALPDGRANVMVNATIIGPDDPKAQRQIGALIKNAAGRGIDTGHMRKAG